MNVEMKPKFDRQAVADFSRQMDEPEWMLELRLQAFDAYAALPLPSLEKTRIDSWNTDGFIPFKANAPVHSIQELPEEITALLSMKEGAQAVLVQQDATVVFQQLPEEWSKQGVVFTSLQKALQTHEQLVKKHFMQKETKFDTHKLAALHTANWSGGAFLYVPQNVEVKVPVQAVFCGKQADSGLLPHIMIILEPNSSVSFTDTFLTSVGTVGVQNVMVDAHIAAGAKLTYTSVHVNPADVVDCTFRHATVERDGHVNWILGEMSDGKAVAENCTHLLGQGASVDSKLVTVGSGKQRGNFTSRVIHTGKHTDSQVLMKGVVKDEATAILNGITFIEKGATKANGEQAEKVLMLSPTSRGDANPILLIDEDDVKAGHAASAGQLDPLQLFYLMSRGISKQEAQRLIINGFVAPVVDAIKVESVRNLLKKSIERKVY